MNKGEVGPSTTGLSAPFHKEVGFAQTGHQNCDLSIPKCPQTSFLHTWKKMYCYKSVTMLWAASNPKVTQLWLEP